MPKRLFYFFLQPLSTAGLAADARVIGHALEALTTVAGVLLAAAALLASGALLLAHLPAILGVIAALLALLHGRLISTIVFLLLAVAWFNWLWNLTPA
jgi:hypothetical protein